ncbi:glutathione S-transferase [Sphingomonas sp.]|uniref:glutathione S-transferase n=1 Tax=Sphingomonas sp. TaxID=28214 RepID=UPI003AFF8299
MIELWYWPGIPGRGEFVRLLLEAAGIPYREMNADADVSEDIGGRRPEPFAPPYIVDTDVEGGLVIAQVANILLYLGDRYGLAPADPAGRHLVHGVQLTVADMVAEAHDVHHPIAAMAYYEEQRDEAARRAADFRASRMPKFLGWFERMAARSGGKWLTGDRWSTADLSLFQLVEGLLFAFPRRMATLMPDHPALAALHARVAGLPELAAYFRSDRRLAYGDGVFRHYPELDGT